MGSTILNLATKFRRCLFVAYFELGEKSYFTSKQSESRFYIPVPPTENRKEYHKLAKMFQFLCKDIFF